MSDTTLINRPKATQRQAKLRHYERQAFIERMQRKLELKEALYPDGQKHRFPETSRRPAPVTSLYVK